MSDYEDLLHNYATHAAQALPPITRDLASALGIPEDDERIGVLGESLARAYMAGAEAGQSETMAQAAEQGFSISVEQLRAPREDN